MSDASRHADHHDPWSAPVMDAAFWDERYGSTENLWSGQPNARLMEEVQALRPGAALDVGCGEGADAIWLAQLGWTVTGIDISKVALHRARAHASAAGPEVERRIEWVQVDLDEYLPAASAFTLVSAHYMHLPTLARIRLHGRLAHAVAPEGILLIVSHDPTDLQTTMGRPPLPDFFATAPEVAASLAPEEWEILTAEARPRQASDPSGTRITIHDAVVKARRRSPAGREPAS
jgi:SAM-dependent methyltransferase